MNFRLSSTLRSGSRIVVRDQTRIVDLQQEAGVHDRAVFLVHGFRQRRNIFLVRRIVFVLEIHLEIGGRYRADKGFLDVEAGHRGLQCLDILAQLIMTDIGDRPRANHRRRIRQPARMLHLCREHHLEFLVDLRKLQGVARRPRAMRRRHTHPLEPADPRRGVVGKARLGLLAVIDDIDSKLDLPADDIGNRCPNIIGQGVAVERIAGILRMQRRQQRTRPGKASGVRGQDAVCAAVHCQSQFGFQLTHARCNRRSGVSTRPGARSPCDGPRLRVPHLHVGSGQD